jgi:hypothetical protein
MNSRDKSVIKATLLEAINKRELEIHNLKYELNEIQVEEQQRDAWMTQRIVENKNG